MNLSKTQKILLGIATLWVSIVPFVAMLGWFAVAILGIIQAETTHNADDPILIWVAAPIFFGIFFCSMVLYIPLLVFYIIHLIRNRNSSDTLRMVMGVGLWLLPFVAMPVYFFTCIFPPAPPDWVLKTPETFNNTPASDVF